MAINRPVTKTLISTTAWGIPVTDQVNANTTDIAALKPTPWTVLQLLNGWVSQLNASTTPQYRKIGDNVQLRGVVSGGAQGTIICNLPVGFRPVQMGYPAIAIYSGTLWGIGVLELNPAGTLGYHAQNPVNTGYIDIGMTYSTIA